MKAQSGSCLCPLERLSVHRNQHPQVRARENLYLPLRRKFQYRPDRWDVYRRYDIGNTKLTDVTISGTITSIADDGSQVSAAWEEAQAAVVVKVAREETGVPTSGRKLEFSC
jgi:hypothetical protein